MQVWNVLRAARWKYRTQKIAKKSPSGHHPTTLSGYIFETKACIDNRKKNLLSGNMSSTCPHNMVKFGPLAAEIVSLVWRTPPNFKGLLHGTLVVGVSQTLRRWTEGATYIRQGGHNVGHWPTFLVCVWNISGTAERICANFTGKTCLKVKVKGQGYQRQDCIFRPFRRPACCSYLVVNIFIL